MCWRGGLEIKGLGWHPSVKSWTGKFTACGCLWWVVTLDEHREVTIFTAINGVRLPSFINKACKICISRLIWLFNLLTSSLNNSWPCWSSSVALRDMLQVLSVCWVISWLVMNIRWNEFFFVLGNDMSACWWYSNARIFVLLYTKMQCHAYAYFLVFKRYGFKGLGYKWQTYLIGFSHRVLTMNDLWLTKVPWVMDSQECLSLTTNYF